jgi:hypothetical protein
MFLAILMFRLPARIPLLAALIAASPVAWPQASVAEDEPVLASADVVDASLLSGPGYTVQPQVPVVGFMARFTVDTAAGPIVADSAEMLEIRLAEVAAIQILDTIGQHEAFGMALRDGLTGAAETVGQVVTNPVDTVKGLPQGVVRYFTGQLTRWGDRFRRHGDRIAFRARNEGDPYDMLGPMNANRDARPPRKKKRWFTSAGKEVVRQVEDQVGHGGAKRMLARRLGIDPYTATTNPALNERLDRLAWGASVGGMGMDQVFGYLPSGGQEVLGQSNRLNDMVWNLAPEDLRKRNRAVLERWCGDAFQIRRFVRHKAFLASVQTRFVDALDALQPSAGCEDVLDLALGADHDVEGRFMANALVLAGGFLGDAARGAALERVNGGLMLRTRDGRIVLPLPVDHLSWTPLAREFFGDRALAQGPRTVLVGGSVSDLALRELTRLGWEIVPRAPYAGAPTYARRCC